MSVDEQGRPEPPLAGSESEVLRGFLDFHRRTLAWKCAGLDAEQLAATHPPSPMTLGGMLKHLAYVEDWWCGVVLTGDEPVEPWRSAPWPDDADWDWHSAADDSPEDLRALWEAAVARSEALVDAAPDGLETVAARADRRTGEPISLRWILVHLVEEYARHNGHADLLREAIDGSVGE
ncbi:MAG: DinB family protein [Aeromicrobium erythreum]